MENFMENNKTINNFYNLITNLDQSIRIIAPGFIILLLFYWDTDFKCTLNAINGLNFFFFLSFIALIGMAYYSIHRVFFSIIDFFGIINCKEKIMERNVKSFTYEMQDHSQKSFYIYNASLHLSAIICELLILSYHFSKFQISSTMYINSWIVFGIIILIKIFETRLEYNIKIDFHSNQKN
jgi:hypothetical protein